MSPSLGDRPVTVTKSLVCLGGSLHWLPVAIQGHKPLWEGCQHHGLAPCGQAPASPTRQTTGHRGRTASGQLRPMQALQALSPSPPPPAPPVLAPGAPSLPLPLGSAFKPGLQF